MTATRPGLTRRMLGYGVALFGIAGLVLVWFGGITFLIDTPFEELRYVVFLGVACTMLSILDRLANGALRS